MERAGCRAFPAPLLPSLSQWLEAGNGSVTPPSGLSWSMLRVRIESEVRCSHLELSAEITGGMRSPSICTATNPLLWTPLVCTSYTALDQCQYSAMCTSLFKPEMKTSPPPCQSSASACDSGWSNNKKLKG
jgi:hypothetical protein